MTNSRTSAWPIIILLIAMLFWGSSFIALKLAFQYYDPMVVIFGRMVLGTLFFLFFLRKFRGVTYLKGDWGRLVLLALFEPCLYFIFEATALSYTTASQASLITALCPLMVAVARVVHPQGTHHRPDHCRFHHRHTRRLLADGRTVGFGPGTQPGAGEFF